MFLPSKLLDQEASPKVCITKDRADARRLADPVCAIHHFREGVCLKTAVFFSGSWQPNRGIGPQFDHLLPAFRQPKRVMDAYLCPAGHICRADEVRCTSEVSLQMLLKTFAAICSRPCALFTLSGANFSSVIHCPQQGFLLVGWEWKLVSVDASKLPLFGPRRLMDWDTRVPFAFVLQR